MEWRMGRGLGEWGTDEMTGGGAEEGKREEWRRQGRKNWGGKGRRIGGQGRRVCERRGESGGQGRTAGEREEWGMRLQGSCDLSALLSGSMTSRAKCGSYAFP